MIGLTVIARSTCDEAIQASLAALDCFVAALLAMTRWYRSSNLRRIAGKLLRRDNRNDAARPEQLFKAAPIRQHRTIHPSVMVRVAGNLFRALARHEL